MKYQGVMFDLDGTLADTLADIAAAGNHMLGELGLETLPIPRFRYLAGLGAAWLVNEALGPDHQHLQSQGLDLFRAYYAEHPVDHCEPYPGIEAMLDQIVERDQALAVLSNKPDPMVQHVMTHLFDRWPFRAVWGHREDQPLKPDPTSAHQIAGDLDIAPDCWLYVGDTKTDIETARQAGMFAVGVLWGFRQEAELREAGADVIIDHPRQLLDLL